MVERFHHAGVAVADIPRAVAFYRDVLGFEPLGPDDPDATRQTAEYFWMAVSDDEWVNLAERPDAVPGRSGRIDDPHLAFRASEREIERIGRRLEERGTDVRESKTSVYFRDPAGNLLEVTRWRGPAETPTTDGS